MVMFRMTKQLQKELYKELGSGGELILYTTIHC